MELWIGSQDRKRITKSMDLQIINISNSTEYAIISFTEMAGDITLGFYKSEERALEVLDEINEVKYYKYMASLDWSAFASSVLKPKPIEEQQLLLAMMNTYIMPKE